jgi:signal transduction histidine kinase
VVAGTVRAGIAAGLVASNERKDEFLAMLDHELRHPLTPITHAIYLLRLGNPEPAIAELLDTIDTETHRLLRFVDDLLDVARIGRGLIEVRREPIDLASVIREATRAVEPFIETRQHTLSLRLPAAPVYVKGDSGRLNQVITNLLENAAKYTEPGGQITLTLEQRDDGATRHLSPIAHRRRASRRSSAFNPTSREPANRPSASAFERGE